MAWASKSLGGNSRHQDPGVGITLGMFCKLRCGKCAWNQKAGRRGGEDELRNKATEECSTRKYCDLLAGESGSKLVRKLPQGLNI